MKKLILLTLIALTLASCKKKETPKKPIDQLPPLTHVGANTAGCLINGKAFVPTNHLMPLSCNYYMQQYFGLSMLHRINNITNSVRIKVNANLQVGSTYRLTVEDYISGQDGNWASHKKDSEPAPSANHYGTNDTNYGELTITHHDYDHATISGTFWFDAVNSEGEVVHVTDGRFDCEY
jgi:hypothetical protein